MIYEGKEYKEVTDGSGSTGDLLSMTKTSHRRDGHFSHIEQSFYFAVDNERYPLAERIMQDGSRIRGYLPSPFKRYRLINQTSKITNQTDTVNSPSHYNQTKIEAIDIIEDVTAGYQSNVKYHIGNAIKYLIRAPFKNNTVEDLKKAVWYIQRAIEKLEGEK